MNNQKYDFKAKISFSIQTYKIPLRSVKLTTDKIVYKREYKIEYFSNENQNAYFSNNYVISIT